MQAGMLHLSVSLDFCEMGIFFFLLGSLIILQISLCSDKSRNEPWSNTRDDR